MINGLILIDNVENLLIGAAIDLCIATCVPISSQYSVASNSVSYANKIVSKQFGIHLMGVYANLTDTPQLKIHLFIQTASSGLTSVDFSGSALITKVGSIG
jgi:hypothetical protein